MLNQLPRSRSKKGFCSPWETSMQSFLSWVVFFGFEGCSVWDQKLQRFGFVVISSKTYPHWNKSGDGGSFEPTGLGMNVEQRLRDKKTSLKI